MNIFLTGSTGYLGSALIKRLTSDSRINKVFALTRKSLSHEESGRIKYINGDLDSLKDVILDERIDAVMHLAAIMRSSDLDRVMDVNVQGTGNVIHFCHKNNIEKIFFTSSVNVYMKREGIYAESKRLAENKIIESGLRYCILRLALVYGPNDGGLERLIDFIKKYRFAPVFGDGKKLEQPIYIDEALNFLHSALFSSKENVTVDAFGREAISYNEMIASIGRVLNKKIYLLHVPVKFVLGIIGILEILRIRIPLTSEQVYHIDEDLSSDMRQACSDYSVELGNFESNLRKYISA